MENFNQEQTENVNSTPERIDFSGADFSKMKLAHVEETVKKVIKKISQNENNRFSPQTLQAGVSLSHTVGPVTMDVHGGMSSVLGPSVGSVIKVDTKGGREIGVGGNIYAAPIPLFIPEISVSKYSGKTLYIEALKSLGCVVTQVDDNTAINATANLYKVSAPRETMLPKLSFQKVSDYHGVDNFLIFDLLSELGNEKASQIYNELYENENNFGRDEEALIGNAVLQDLADFMDELNSEKKDREESDKNFDKIFNKFEGSDCQKFKDDDKEYSRIPLIKEDGTTGWIQKSEDLQTGEKIMEIFWNQNNDNPSSIYRLSTKGGKYTLTSGVVENENGIPSSIVDNLKPNEVKDILKKFKKRLDGREMIQRQQRKKAIEDASQFAEVQERESNESMMDQALSNPDIRTA